MSHHLSINLLLYVHTWHLTK